MTEERIHSITLTESDVIKTIRALHYVKSVRNRNFSGPYFLAFGLNMERYGMREIPTRKNPNTDTFYAVIDVSKEHGHDNISVKMIKLCANSVVHPFTLIFQNSLIFKTLFADGTSLFSEIYDLLEITNMLNNDLRKICRWAKQWKMVFNPDPTKQK